VFLVILPFTDVSVPRPFTFRAEDIGALSVSFTTLQFAGVFGPIGKDKGARPVCYSVLVFTDVSGPIGKGSGAVPVFFAILPFTGIFVTIAFIKDTKAIGPRVPAAFTGRQAPPLR
jgi:hypothetical protein